MPMSDTLRAKGSPLRSRRPIGARRGRGASGRRRQHSKMDLNLHAYVGADPVNWIDPEGLSKNEIVITAPPRPQNPPEMLRPGTFGPASPGGGGNPERGEDNAAACLINPEHCPVINGQRDETEERPRGDDDTWIQLAGSQRGGNNMGSGEFRGVSDEELKRRYKAAKGPERVKIQREQKDRGIRNIRKGRGSIIKGLFQLFIGDWQMQVMSCQNPANAGEERCRIT